MRDKRKRKDECQFCTSRSCSGQIYRVDYPYYDEIYCDKHQQEAFEASDKVLGVGNGIYRTFKSSTGKLKRGENLIDVSKETQAL